MMDIRYLYREWQEQLDALEDLLSGLSSLRDSLQAADDNLGDIDRDIADKDDDRAIAFYHGSLRDEIDTLCDSYSKLKNYCESIGDAIRETVDTPFYKRMDNFAQSMEKLSINNYTTENTLGVTTTANYDGVDVSIPKQSISIHDIFESSPAMDKMLKEDYNALMELPDAPDLSYGDYKEAIAYTRSFDYKSIEDSQLSKEFWASLGIGAVIVIASFVCPPAGLALGIAYGTLELGTAAAGRDWLTQRELGTGERVMRGTFALLDIIPGVRAFGASMHTARAATGTLGKADNVLQVMGKCTLQRTKNFAGQMGRASRRTGAFGRLLISNTNEAGQLFLTKSKGLGNRALSAGKSSIDDLGRKYRDLAAKGKNVLSGNFDDIRKYMKSLTSGEYVLVATPDASVFRIAKNDLGESSLELVARDKAIYAMNGINVGTEGISGAKKYKVKKGPEVKSAKINTKGIRGGGTKPLSAMSDAELSKLGYRRYDDGSIRDSLGHFVGNSGTVPGTPGADKAADYLNKEGYTVNGREISVRSDDGTLRRYDLVVTDADGKVIGIEVKSGSATSTKQQRRIDNELNSAGGFNTVGHNAVDANVDRLSSTKLIRVDKDGNVYFE